MMNSKNIDPSTVLGFGDEWERFDQADLDEQELDVLFTRYFSIFPWSILKDDAVGFDMGCGSGRWAKLVAPRIGVLHCIDPSSALEVAKRNLSEYSNCFFHNSSVDSLNIPEASMDFGYSLGVLHHVPDTAAGIQSCAKLLKPGAPFLLYLYYAFDNKPKWFRRLWLISDVLRRCVSKLPHRARYLVSQLIAIILYWPLARFALFAEWLRVSDEHIQALPLSAYRGLSFYTMRTDALDRFGTCLEQRFTRIEITKMMEIAGFKNISFSNNLPYWCAVGFRGG
jgi:SAM-dependent methyltransferase